MKNIGVSECLILASSIMSFANLNLAIATLALGVLGAITRFSIFYSEKQQKAKTVEETKENISSIISQLTSGIQGVDKSNLH